MDTVFIGWSGNRPLAYELAEIINRGGKKRAIVGGGQPMDLYVGAQVMNQICQSDQAILLLEDKNGSISPNLMLEWGYLLAKMPASNICSVLINKRPSELPSDILGSFVEEVQYDRTTQTDSEIAQVIFQLFERQLVKDIETDYFSRIADWKRVFVMLKSGQLHSDENIRATILAGVLAAYYYSDNKELRQYLETVNRSAEVNSTVYFAKAYIDVFLKSENMRGALSLRDFLPLEGVFKSVLQREKSHLEEIEMLTDILCYDVYGLGCTLFLKNEEIAPGTRSRFADKAKECFEKGLSLIDEFGAQTKVNGCLVMLLKSYLYNDTAHLYRDSFRNDTEFLRYLDLSVSERQTLFNTFSANYAANTYLITKLDQEYTVALSEQCNYMHDPTQRSVSVDMITCKYLDWEQEFSHTRSLQDRIKANLKKMGVEV